MYKMENSLNGEWRLYIAENKECKSFADKLCSEEEVVKYKFTQISGSVPGNFELDMHRAGLIGDPYYGSNPLEIQKLENRHLWYATDFCYNGENSDRVYLEFDGIDTFADIYLNGILIGSADNMFITHEFKATCIKIGNNKLLVHIKPAVIEARKYSYDMDVFTHLRYNSGSLAVRKAAHSFGWDILPRFVSGGIWRDVTLVEKKSDCINDIYLQTTRLNQDSAELSACYRLELSGDFSTDYSLVLSGQCGDSSFNYSIDRLWNNSGNITFTFQNPQLWWPRDMGEQKLYKVSAVLTYKGEIIDKKEFNFGIRTVKLKRSEIIDKNGKGEFCFFVNDKPLFIRGTNWVALDAFHSRDVRRLPAALEMLKDINCNMVRCWGGNVYEDHPFFDFCDKNGILVWQDFAMGCATYPQDDAFAGRLKIEIEQVVKKLRQHPSIAVWAGDNECDVAAAFWNEGPKQNPDNNRLTRKIIPELISRIDPWREYLPSSPYVSSEAYMAGDETLLPENHLWGPRDYFKGEFYTKSPAYFASETGYHGCPSPESVKKFISPEKLWPWQNNDEWQLHSTCMEPGNNVPYAFRNALMASQIKTLFGFEPQDIETFALASQLSQAEADKFFIERFRSGKWRRTGIIWWNLVDGWPQFSDSVVDYYFTKKAAYSFIKRSQEPVCLMITEPHDGKLTLVGVNEFLASKNIRYTVTDLCEKRTVCEGEVNLGPNGLDKLAEIPFDDKTNRFYLIEWRCDGIKYKNHYISGCPPYDFNKYVTMLKEGGLLQTEGF